MQKTDVADAVFVFEVNRELKEARRRFPGNAVMSAALTEQVGKLHQALIECRRGSGTGTGVWKLAVTVASMACRVAVEGDSSFPEYVGPEQPGA